MTPGTARPLSGPLKMGSALNSYFLHGKARTSALRPCVSQGEESSEIEVGEELAPKKLISPEAAIWF